MATPKLDWRVVRADFPVVSFATKGAALAFVPKDMVLVDPVNQTVYVVDPADRTNAVTAVALGIEARRKG